MRQGKLDEGFAQLRTAVEANDKLKYDEPPGWMIPVRHSLGATLMAHQRYAEAERVYRKDLTRLPNNGWALFGLSEALLLQGKNAEGLALCNDFKQAWNKGDLTITSSCLDQPRPAAGSGEKGL